ncbi:hypothetical protein MPER_12375 [Moniliophthora perniciosa FA553]|nr:hypothetical protein MPER_12375 [Moniliophthora perniciosa FA553]
MCKLRAFGKVTAHRCPLWRSIIAADDCDAHESSLALVAARNPFRETGPPANMAKLILLRHKEKTQLICYAPIFTTIHCHSRVASI